MASPGIGLAALVLMVLAAGAVCTWWLIHVREPQWREIGVVGLLLVGVLVTTLTALNAGAGR